MKLPRLLSALCLALLSAGARAQIGVYLNPIVTPVSISQPDTGVFAFLGQGSTSRIFGGVSVGGYVDLEHSPKFDLGIDVRDEFEHGNGALLNSFLIGGRLSGRPAHSRFRPYAELLGGVGTTHSPLSPVRASKAMFKVYGGLDYAVARHIDLRAFEVGYGSLTTVSAGLLSAGGVPAVPAASLLSVSGGLVFRFR